MENLSLKYKLLIVSAHKQSQNTQIFLRCGLICSNPEQDLCVDLLERNVP